MDSPSFQTDTPVENSGTDFLDGLPPVETPPSDLTSLYEIWGLTRTEDKIPTYVPARFEQQYRIVSNGGSSAVYIYDSRDQRWFTPGASAGGSTGSRMRAFLGANLAATASPSWGVVVFSTSSFDTNSEYNTGNGQFTAKAAGYYLVTYQITIQAGGGSTWTANDFFDTRITVNTTEVSYARNDSGTTTIGPVFSRTDVVHLAIGDSVRVENKAQGSGVIMAAGDQTFFNVVAL